MPDNLYIILSYIDGNPNHTDPRYKGSYHKLAMLCINSMIHHGFPTDQIICICENEDYISELNSRFGINAIHGPKIPKSWESHVNPSKWNLQFYKPLCIHEVVPLPSLDAKYMAICDVDCLFLRSPNDCLIEMNKIDIASQWTRQFRYPETKNPNKRLCLVQQYLYEKFMKKQHIPMPSERLSSGFVVFDSRIYKEITSLWFRYIEHIMEYQPKYLYSDQVLLSSARDALCLKFKVFNNKYTLQFTKPIPHTTVSALTQSQWVSLLLGYKELLGSKEIIEHRSLESADDFYGEIQSSKAAFVSSHSRNV